MSFGYDRDDLGYEWGYDPPSPSVEKQKTQFGVGDPEVALVTYHCQDVPPPDPNKPLNIPKPILAPPPPPPDGSTEVGGVRYDKKGFKIGLVKGNWVQIPDATKTGADGETYGKWTKQDGSVEYWKGAAQNVGPISEANLPGGSWAAIGAPDPGKAKAAVGEPPKPAKAPEGTPYTKGGNELQLRKTLADRGLKPNEVEAFMARFPIAHEGKDHEIKKRENAIEKYTKGPDRKPEFKIEARDAASLRNDIAEYNRDQAVANFKRNKDVKPQQAYDNLVARGIITPKWEKKGDQLLDVNRPAADATWPKDPKDKSTANPKNWPVLSVQNMKAEGLSPQKAYDRLAEQGMIDTAKVARPNEKATWKEVGEGRDWAVPNTQTTTDPLFSSSSVKLTPGDVEADTKRRNYVAKAHDKYVDWATSPKEKGGLGLTKEQAEARFIERAVQLRLMTREPDGSLKISESWNPDSTDPNSPGQSFFHGKEGEAVKFEADGTLSKEALSSFRHESVDPAKDDSATNPVTRVTKENVTKEVNRDTLYVSLTGQAPEGSNMKVVKREGKTFLVAPDGKESEIRVIDPPLTKGQALAYMQSRSLVDAEGRPLPNVSPDAFMSEARSIQMGELGPNQIKFRVANWERSQIVKNLSGPPFNFSGEQITRYMHSKGWLGEHPNLDSMEEFRKKTAGVKAGSEAEKQIREEVKAADVKGNDPTEQPEKDRADTIIDTLKTAKSKEDAGAREGRAGRETSRSEGAASRDTQIKVEQMRQEGEDRRQRERREFDREEAAKKRDFDAEQGRLQRAHDSAERDKDRKNQMWMSLIQLMGSVITSAMQVMGQVTAAQISGGQQMAGQIIGGMRGRA